jgi:hypothetical protein
MVTRLNNVTVIARRAVLISASKVVQDSVIVAVRADAKHDTEVVLATLARHSIQGGSIGIQRQASMRLLAR